MADVETLGSRRQAGARTAMSGESVAGQGQSRASGFNARNLCPKTARFLPWFPDEAPLTLCANICRRRRRACERLGAVRALDQLAGQSWSPRPASQNAFKALVRRLLERARIQAAPLAHTASNTTHGPGSAGGSRQRA